MKRADNYRGRRRRGGLSTGQVGVVAITLLVAILAMTMKASGQWTGLSAGEQLYQAMLVATDLD